jgi:acyl-CoA thioester hydrolase
MNVGALREEPTVSNKQAGYYIGRRQVEHSDIDGYGVVHFARYAAFMETAALGLLQNIDLGIQRLQRSGVELRVRELSLKYRASAAFADNLVIEANIARIGIAHLRIGVRILRERGGQEMTALVAGELDVVFVCSETGRPIPVPRN